MPDFSFLFDMTDWSDVSDCDHVSEIFGLSDLARNADLVVIIPHYPERSVMREMSAFDLSSNLF